MVTSALVKIWDTLVGAVVWDDQTGLGSFEYDPDFIKTGWELSPVKMPLADARNNFFSFPDLRRNDLFKGMPGLLADVLPDRFGSTLINVWLARQGRAAGSMNPVEMLCFIGKRGMGALEFEPATFKGTASSSKLEINDLVKTAAEILSGRKKFTANLTGDKEKALSDIIKIGTSAGGARAKAVIAFNSATGEIRSGQAHAPRGFSHWLLKFDGVSDKKLGHSHGYGRIEMAYHLMAKDAGIEMMECRLLEESNRAHFMTRRFDRPDADEKLHVQTFCAMEHLDFNEVNLYSYEQLFQTMRFLNLDYQQAVQLFRRMVFNVLSRNCDDHTKNFSFVMNKKGEWRLSPAYDVCFTYNPQNPWVSHQALSINGKREDFKRSDFLQLADNMNIRKADAIISQVYGVVQNWPAYARNANVDKKFISAIQDNLVKI
jgi:serine/threonine-protein kinase HipA